MKFCRNLDTRMSEYIATGCALVCLLFGFINLLSASKETKIAFLVVVLVELLPCTYFGVRALWQRRKFELCNEGIRVSYFPSHSRLIPWNTISEVAVCNVHYHTKKGWELVIRVAMGDVFKVPEFDNKLWAYESFSMKYHKYIIIIDYTDEVFEEFQQNCPIPLKDCR